MHWACLGRSDNAYETARALGARALFVERDQDGVCIAAARVFNTREKVLILRMWLQRGGSVPGSWKLFAVTRERFAVLAALSIAAAASADFGVPFRALLQLDIASYDPADCPLL